MKVVAAIEVPPRRQPRSANDDALRFARSCYDHLAGQVGVAVTDALVAMGHIVLTDEGGEVTSSGGRFLCAFGADLRPRTRRIFCQLCLDWSERRYHLKGLVGARILDRLLELGWLAVHARPTPLGMRCRCGAYRHDLSTSPPLWRVGGVDNPFGPVNSSRQLAHCFPQTNESRSAVRPATSARTIATLLSLARAIWVSGRSALGAKRKKRAFPGMPLGAHENVKASAL
jgi:hypothetical protein